MARTSERAAIAAALFAVADMGGTILLSTKDADRFAGYAFHITKTIVTDFRLACESGSFMIERPFYGDNHHGWRLGRLHASTAQSYVGPMFLTSGAFADAMRLVSDMCQVRSKTLCDWCRTCARCGK